MAFVSVFTASSSMYSLKKPLNRVVPIRCSAAAYSPSSTSILTQTKSTQFNLKTYHAKLILEIDQKLDEAISIQYPEQIYEAMMYAVLAKGAKRATTVMCIATCELFGGNRLAALPTAIALEIACAASTIRDDLSRRGRLSLNTNFGTSMEIQTSAALFPLTFRHLVSHTPSSLIPETRLLRVIAEISQAVGSTGRAAGQLIDLEGGSNMVELMHEKKYGKMGECSAICGGLIAGVEDDEIERLRRYGRSVGVLYQLVNDMREERMKKNNGDGDNEGEKSYVGIYGVEKAMEMAEKLRADAKRELDGFEKYGDLLIPLYSFVDYAADMGFTIDVST